MTKKIIILIPCLLILICFFAMIICYFLGWNQLNNVILLSNKGNMAWNEYTENDFITKDDNMKLSIVDSLDENFDAVSQSIIYPKSLLWSRMAVCCKLKFKVENLVTGKVTEVVQSNYLVTMKFSRFKWKVVSVQ